MKWGEPLLPHYHSPQRPIKATVTKLRPEEPLHILFLKQTIENTQHPRYYLNEAMKASIIKLKKRNEWILKIVEKQLLQMHTTVMNAHREYVKSFPDITEEQIQYDAWEVNFETDHFSIFAYADRYSRSRLAQVPSDRKDRHR